MTPKVGDTVRCVHKEKGTVVEGVVRRVDADNFDIEGLGHGFTFIAWQITVTKPAQPEPSDKAMAVANTWYNETSIRRRRPGEKSLARLIDQHYDPNERLLRDVTTEELAAAFFVRLHVRTAQVALNRLRRAK